MFLSEFNFCILWEGFIKKTHTSEPILWALIGNSEVARTICIVVSKNKAEAFCLINIWIIILYIN